MEIRLQQVLDIKNLTQKELAERIGVKQQYISKIISGNIGLGTSIIEKIAIEFPDINLRWLIGLPNETPLLESPKQDQSDVSDIRFENILAGVVIERLRPYLKEFRSAHNSSGKQKHDIIQLLRVLVARIDEVQDDVKNIKETSKGCFDALGSGGGFRKN